MNEFYLALKMMNEAQYKWPMPPVKEPAAIVRQAAPAPAALPAAEREELRQALERMAPRLTGRLVWDPVARLYVPELKPEEKR